MDRWRNSVAVVSGASTGIGAAIVKDLLAADLKVVGLARRKELIEEYKKDLPEDQQKRLYAVHCDVGDKDSVKKAFDFINSELGGVDIMINNAGGLKFGQLSLMDEEDVLQTLKVNVMGVVSCTKHAFKSMKERNVNGHVVIINSVLGHMIPSMSDRAPMMNIYPGSKYAITAITEIYRQEFVGLKTKVKITSVSPGMTDTPILPEHFKPTSKMLKAEDVSSCVLFTLSTPEHMQIHEITLQANQLKD